MSELLDRSAIEAAFACLADKLRRARVVGHVYVVGGAAMALAYDAERITRDVDALITGDHDAVTIAAADVAGELDLPRSWLNEQATAYLSSQEDLDAPRVFDHPNLKVSTASPRFVLAMKLRAARPRDIADIVTLMDRLGMTQRSEAMAVHDAVFPGDPLPERTEARLRTYWPA